MSLFARLPEFKNDKFYCKDFYSDAIKGIRIINNKAGLVLSATHSPQATGVKYDDQQTRFTIQELPLKYRRILEKHGKQRKLVDDDTIYVGGIVFLLNGMCRYFKHWNCSVELDVDDCVDNRPEMMIHRTLVYFLTYDNQGGDHRGGTIASCEALTPQKRLTTLEDVFEAERIEKAVI